MGIPAERLKSSLDSLASTTPEIAAALGRSGYPAERRRDPGFETLVRTIVGQQVSVASAAAVWRKLEDCFGAVITPEAIATGADDDFQACGLSRQKRSYARSLADEVMSGRLVLDSLPSDDEEAIAALVRVKGIGRWSAEIYLLFAEGRPDIFPAGDLAIQLQLGRLLGRDRPDERTSRALVERWAPHRGAASIFLWHLYNSEVL